MKWLTKLAENALYAYLDWSMRKIPPPPTDMTDYRTFAEYFEILNIRNFNAEEFTNYFTVTRRGVTNSAPPREIWGNILPTLRIVDQLRDHYGTPITILSSYRSPKYNAAIGDAAPKSQHLQFRALDITVQGHTPREVFRTLSAWRDQGQFRGGLGLYSSFVHIDTRGTNATWGT